MKWMTGNFEYALKKWIDRSQPQYFISTKANTCRQKYSLASAVFGDSYGTPAEAHAKLKK